MADAEGISLEQVKKVAQLARLELDDGRAETFRAQLADVVSHFERLSDADVEGVEPLTHVGDEVNRLDDDEPGVMLGIEALRAMAPRMGPGEGGRFFEVPKVLGDGGSA